MKAETHIVGPLTLLTSEEAEGNSRWKPRGLCGERGKKLCFEYRERYPDPKP